MLAATSDISAHFTSPPFHQRERQNPAVRTILTTNEVMGGAATFTMLSTTAAWREANPGAYAAVLAALEEAIALIAADPLAAADALIAASDNAGLGRDELAAILRDPDIRFTTAPENTMRYAEFMHAIGSLENRPASWRDLFFPEVHDRPGS
jgi:NitT/TauT family transport system substrate-binding protein